LSYVPEGGSSAAGLDSVGGRRPQVCLGAVGA